MAKLDVVKQPEQWLVEVNGSYGILFEEHTLTADAVDGTVIAEGIVSGGGSTGDVVRVMVRGNPSKVKESQLTGDASALPASIVLV